MDENKENNNRPLEPYELFGIECGEGWYKLLQPIFDYIEEYNKDKVNDDEKLIPLQIKEKFGGLRVYMNFYTDELNKLIEDAEDEAYNTCEICGSKEDIGQTTGWITTMCRECVKKMAKKSKTGYVNWRSYKDKKLHMIFDDDTKDVVSDYNPL